MADNHRNTPIEDWSNCTRCRLHRHRRNVVVRGQWIVCTQGIKPTPGEHPNIHKINPLPPEKTEWAWDWASKQYSFKNLREYPPHILVIGEAPGESEDFHTQPFYGRAGHIFRTMLDCSKTLCLLTITNTVCCRPTHNTETTENSSKWGKNRQPELSEQGHCVNHVHQLLDSYKFDGILLLGLIAEQYFKTFIKTKHRTLVLQHPAHIARMNFKLLPIKEDARKFELWVKSIQTGRSCLGRF